MPTVLRIGPYRFYFYSHEPNEPPHIHIVHIDRDASSAKFWLESISLAINIGFSAKEWLSGIDYAALLGKCQQMRHRRRKRSKLLKP